MRFRRSRSHVPVQATAPSGHSPQSDADPAGSGDGARTLPSFGRKSLLLGILGSGVVLAGQSSDVAVAALPADAARWAPATAYALGQQVISPNNDVVSAKVAHTSSSAYSTDTVKWTLSPTYGRTIQTSDYGLHVSPTGSDSNDGLSPATAKLTLATAITGIPAGSLVKLARGRHTITSLLPTKAIRLVGAGTVMSMQPGFGDSQYTSATSDQIGGTVLYYAGTTGAALKIAAKAAMRNSSISDLTILGPGSGTSRGLVLGETADGSELIRLCLDRVNVANFSTGVWSACENSTFNALFIQGCLTGLYTENGFNGNAISAINVENCTNYGIRLTDSDANTFTGGVVQGNAGVPLSLESLAYANTFTGMYFEQAAAAHSIDFGVVGGADFNTLAGCHLQDTAPAIRVAGNHNRLIGNEYTPAVTLTGSYNNLQGTFNVAVTDTGTSNVRIDPSSGVVRFGDCNVRIGSEKKFYFESVGTNSYLARNTNGSTELGLNNAPFSLVAPVVQTSAPAKGAAAALPATPAGYLKLSIAGVVRWMPYY